MTIKSLIDYSAVRRIADSYDIFFHLIVKQQQRDAALGNISLFSFFEGEC